VAEPRSRVVLVRDPRDAVSGGGGCCSGDVRPFDEGGGHRHADAGGSGALYLALRDALPDDVGLEVVAPTNWAWLVPALLTDGRRRGLRGRALLAAVRRGLRVASVLVDGVPVPTGTAEQTVDAVLERLALLPR